MTSAKRLEELEVWQLGTELRDLVVASVDRYGTGMSRDFKDDLLRSSRSIPANAAEGFGYFEHSSRSIFGLLAHQRWKHKITFWNVAHSSRQATSPACWS